MNRSDLDEPLEKVTLRLVRCDSPAPLPYLVSLEKRSRVEEMRTAGEGIIHRLSFVAATPPAGERRDGRILD
jgi:hypothetical protein